MFRFSRGSIDNSTRLLSVETRGSGYIILVSFFFLVLTIRSKRRESLKRHRIDKTLSLTLCNLYFPGQ